MSNVFEGVRIVELAQWVFVPSSAALLADLGADVLKIEHPKTGDPARGLHTQGFGVNLGSVDPRIQQNNRGKRSVGIDIKKPDGLETLLRLIEGADVFVTSFRPGSLARLGLSVEQLRERNPRLIYARGHGLGVRGPQANLPSYDATAFWARGGIGHTVAPPDLDRPLTQRPAFGDHTSAMNLAFGIASALFRRSNSGEASVVDVSLLSTASWVLSADIVSCGNKDYDPHAVYRGPTNPLVGTYETKDGRHISLVMLQAERHWDLFCQGIGRPDLLEDARFADTAARHENAAVLVGVLQAEFGARTYAHWREQLATVEIPWAPVQSAREVRDDPQARANGYLTTLEAPDGTSYDLVSNPCQFDEQPPALTPAPEVGAHTEEVLLETGLDWEEISRLKAEGAIT
ncbi:CoA transferase [Myxococcota bacterium]|nr:CoA transferase [Myxococcota bacterium]